MIGTEIRFIRLYIIPPAFFFRPCTVAEVR